MKKCNCKNNPSGRLYKVLLKQVNNTKPKQNELATYNAALTEFSIYICTRCIMRAYVKPMAIAGICLTAAILVMGIKPETQYLWLQFLIIPALLLTGGVLGMIAIIIFNAAIYTNYFLYDTIILHVSEKHSDFYNLINSGPVSLAIKRNDFDMANYRLKVSVLLSSVVFWLSAPVIGAWLNTLLF